MDIQKFIDNFAQQFDDPDSVELNPSTEFKKLDDWNSLVALSVICMVDDEYGKTINGDDIRKSNSIHDLFNLVQAL